MDLSSYTFYFRKKLKKLCCKTRCHVMPAAASYTSVYCASSLSQFLCARRHLVVLGQSRAVQALAQKQWAPPQASTAQAVPQGVDAQSMMFAR